MDKTKEGDLAYTGFQGVLSTPLGTMLVGDTVAGKAAAASSATQASGLADVAGEAGAVLAGRLCTKLLQRFPSVREAFNSFDLDRDGKITLAEFDGSM